MHTHGVTKSRAVLVSTLLSTLMAGYVYADSDGYEVPQRNETNIIVASYNIKWFGQSKHDLQKIAQVIQCFDVCGILEVKNENIIGKLVEELDRLTMTKWGYCYGIRTRRPMGAYFESYAVVWRTDRVALGNGIISNIWDINETYRNDPYIVSFNRGGFDFILFLVHTRWESDEEGNRLEEIKGLAQQIEFMNSFLDEKDIIIAGDFNYSGTSDVVKDFESTTSFVRIDPTYYQRSKMISLDTMNHMIIYL